MKDNKEYKVKVRFVLEGEVTVNACSKEEAKEIVDEIIENIEKSYNVFYK